MENKKSFVSRFAEALVKKEIMKEPEAMSFVQEFHDRAKGNVVSFLLEEGLVEKEDILRALSSMYDVPSFDVRGYFFNHELLMHFPKDFLLENVVIPLEVEEDLLSVVVNNPEDEEAIAKIGDFVSYNVMVYVGIQEDICDAIEEYYDEDVITAEIEEQEEESGNETDDSDIVDILE